MIEAQEESTWKGFPHKSIYQTDAELRLALFLVGCAVPDINHYESWKLQRRLLPHADRIYASLQHRQRSPINTGNLSVEELFFSWLQNIGNLYRDQGALVEAETIYQTLLEEKERLLGPGNASTLHTANNLGNLQSDQGKLVQAERLYRQALEGYEKIYDPDCLPILNTVSNLGGVYREQGSFEKAEKMYEQALQGYSRVYGSDCFLQLNTINNLGNLYYDQGKLAEAEKQYIKALEGFLRVLGPDHLLTINPIQNLARLYSRQGKVTEAKRLYKRALKGYESMLGAGHPKVSIIRVRIEKLNNRRLLKELAKRAKAKVLSVLKEHRKQEG